MAPTTGRAQYIIEEVTGCGLFQSILVITVSFTVIPSFSYGVMVMAFGNYNPGWRCLDVRNNSNNNGNSSNLKYSNSNNIIINNTGSSPQKCNDSRLHSNSAGKTRLFVIDGIGCTEDVESESEFVVGTCEDYKLCSHVEFDPSSSTIVTEWSLLCQDSWKISLIIAMQMLGMFIGSYGSGQLADLWGRKKTLYLGIALCGVSQLVSSFSINWIMFLVLRFLFGVFGMGNLLVTLLYVAEFTTIKWRAFLGSLPVWYFGATALSFTTWAFRDWRKVELAGFLFSVVAFLPIFWVPESLRWYEVKFKTREFFSVVKKVAKWNKKTLKSFEDVSLDMIAPETDQDGDKKYTIRDLFRKGYKIITICAFFLNFSFSLVFYATTFASKSLYGDFYINFFIVNVIPIPIFFLSMLGIRILSRKMNMFIFLSFTAISAFVSVGLLVSRSEFSRSFGSTVAIGLAKGFLDATWFALFCRITEIYPTVVRGLSLGSSSLVARIGGILAPFIIPRDQGAMPVFMSAMATLISLCCLVSLLLPETRGKILKEKFSDDVNDTHVDRSRSLIQHVA